MKVGHVSCDKDTREILSNTIMKHINNSLKKIVHKHLVMHRHNGNGSDTFTITYADEDLNNTVDGSPDFFLFHCL